eukprot:TRINITY_DN66919_c7_g4_i1.p1 TRINITY_DN66919_c7_g4~~TRINITY_DN66919_c7_g4_i1.p1  ORF type:complete len:344 (+),score=154.63 TRINITY_DN66919_c7_g4_i1:38-1069(+)
MSNRSPAASPSAGADGQNEEKKPDVSRIIKVGGHFIVGKKLGSGSFGDIYLGTHDEIPGMRAAIKLERADSRHPQLLYEYKMYRVLGDLPCMPHVYYYGREGDYNVLILELLGPSLETLFNYCGRKLSLKTVLMIAEEMICRVQAMHSRNYIHRDLKPDNFLIGLGKYANRVYMIDLGLAKRFRDPATTEHIEYVDRKNLTGTARYASVNAHRGIAQTRRDDLEALGYIIIYFIKGRLPWQGLQAKTKQEKYEKISRTKITIDLAELCSGCPSEVLDYMKYCRNLRFDEKPDYAYLRRLFRDLFLREGYLPDFMYDWTGEAKIKGKKKDKKEKKKKRKKKDKQ